MPVRILSGVEPPKLTAHAVVADRLALHEEFPARHVGHLLHECVGEQDGCIDVFGQLQPHEEPAIRVDVLDPWRASAMFPTHSTITSAAFPVNVADQRWA